VALLAALAAGTAYAHRITFFRAILNGYQEVPSVSTAGRAGFIGTLNLDETALQARLQYFDMQGVPQAAHIHFGQRGVNGGVMAWLCGGGGRPACPPSPGTVNVSIGPADIVGPAGQGIDAGEFVEALRALRSGNAYVNVHTDLFAGGEIRGQIFDEDRDEH
jgi:hypothetical protein